MKQFRASLSPTDRKRLEIPPVRRLLEKGEDMYLRPKKLIPFLISGIDMCVFDVDRFIQV